MRNSPAIADIDGDGRMELVFGGTKDSLGQGTLWVLKDDGTVAPGWPLRVPLADFSGCNVVIANFDSDTTTLEILAASRLHGVYLISHDGEVLPGWPISGYYFWEYGSYCAAADFDGDGICEAIIAGSYNLGIHRADGTPLPGWPLSLGSSTEYPGNPTIGDISGDGNWDLVYTLKDKIYAFDIHANPIPGFPLVAKDLLYGAPTLGDIDGDGEIEIAIGCFASLVYIWKTGAPNSSRAIAWPTMKGNFARTGKYGDHWRASSIAEVELPQTLKVSVYPNPFNSAVNINVESGELQVESVEIFDIAGRRVAELDISATSGKGRTTREIDTDAKKQVVWTPGDSLPSGIYLVRIVSDGKTIAAKKAVLLR